MPAKLNIVLTAVKSMENLTAQTCGLETKPGRWRFSREKKNNLTGLLRGNHPPRPTWRGEFEVVLAGLITGGRSSLCETIRCTPAANVFNIKEIGWQVGK